ncbi:kielin/chordin-like protein [Dreissena polymorpha]|nr:kielin/chordin-like protein [Dreissena polymorpha]XP_052225838.1 kielin/chordin-like protein [Dreissena polymorpha]
MLLAVSFLLFVTLCGTVSSQTYKGYPPIRPYPIKSCYNVYCPTVYCHGQYIPKGECCPRCPKGYGYQDTDAYRPGGK